MKWTKNKPGRPGWYWFKRTETDAGETCEIVWWGMGNTGVGWTRDSGRSISTIPDNYWWQGPILPDGDVEADLNGELAKVARRIACDNQCASCVFSMHFCSKVNDGACSGYVKRSDKPAFDIVHELAEKETEYWKARLEYQLLQTQRLYQEGRGKLERQQCDQYQLLHYDGICLLRDGVNAMLKEGWKCLGGVSVCISSGQPTYSQAMIKEVWK